MSELENFADEANEAPTEQPRRTIKRAKSGTGKPKGSVFSDVKPEPAKAPEAPKRVARDPGVLPDGNVRRPLGKREAKLKAPPREGYYRRYINDIPGRVESALAGGYTFVQDAKGRNWERTVDRNERGGGINAFLMEIPLELYNADFAAKQDELDELDAQIYGGTYGPGAATDGRYVPQHAPIKIDIQKGPGSEKYRR